MHEPCEKVKEDGKKSLRNSRETTTSSVSGFSTIRFVDTRPTAVTQSKLNQLARGSSRTRQLQKIQRNADSRFKRQLNPDSSTELHDVLRSDSELNPEIFSTNVIVSPKENNGEEHNAPMLNGIVQRYESQEEKIRRLAFNIASSVEKSCYLKVLDYLAKGLGMGGARFWRSSEVRAFREKLKDAARSQAYRDITHNVEHKQDIFREQNIGPAMQDHIEVEAINLAHRQAKDIVNDSVLTIAKHWLDAVWDGQAMRQKAMGAAHGSISSSYSFGRLPDELQTRERAREIATAAVSADLAGYLAQARSVKNQLLKPKSEEQEPNAEQEQDGIAWSVAENARQSELGLKSLKQAITANTTAQGLGIVGKLIDQAIPLSGEQISLDISLSIPTGDGITSVILKLTGKAGRGISGFSTSGVATMGNPDRLEIMAQFSLGVGAETFGLKGDLSVGFFTRAGSDRGTSATMKALSYAAYRAALGINKEFGVWWAGSGKGSDISYLRRSEIWAAGVEEQVFKEDDGTLEKNAFADVGGSLSGSGGINVLDVFSAEMNVGGEVFKRFDADSLKASLGADFAERVQGKDAAKRRRSSAKGRTTTALGFGASVTAKINGQEVTFAASFSMEDDFEDNWGVEISAAIDSGSIGEIAEGIVLGLTGASSALAKVMAKKKKVGTTVNFLGDLTQMINAGLENQISSGLATVWSVGDSKFAMGVLDPDLPGSAPGITTKSTIQVAVTFGRAGGKGVFRFEIRDSKSLKVSVGLGSVGLEVNAAKGRRIFAVGKEEQGWQAELIGLRKT